MSPHNEQIPFDHPCQICGKCESVMTVARSWLGRWIMVDECARCHAELDASLGQARVQSTAPANYKVAYIDKYRIT